MSTLMPTAAASSDTNACASPGVKPHSPAIARADKDEPGACPICTCVSRPIMHTTARHHGLVQCSAGLRGCIPGGSSTLSDSLQAGRAHRSREAFEAWHVHTWAAHEAAWAGWSAQVGPWVHTSAGGPDHGVRPRGGSVIAFATIRRVATIAGGTDTRIVSCNLRCLRSR